MKVLEHGNTYQMIRCKECAALLEITKADIQEDTVDTEDHDITYYFKWVECPECGGHAFHKETKTIW